MKTKTTAYALRLPTSVKAEAEKRAAGDGTSLNQIVATAIAEKVSALGTAQYLRKGKAGPIRPRSTET